MASRRMVLEESSGSSQEHASDPSYSPPLSPSTHPPQTSQPPQSSRPPRQKSVVQKPRVPRPCTNPPPSQPKQTAKRPSTTSSTQSQPPPKKSKNSEDPVLHQTNPRPVRGDLSNWFNSIEEEDNYLQNFHHRNLLKPFWVQKEAFLDKGFRFPDLIPSLIPFISLHLPIYPDLVRAFYSTLKIEDNTLTATVKKVQIRVGPKRWTRITGLGWTGEYYPGFGVPNAWSAEFDHETARKVVCHQGAPRQGEAKIKSSSLTTDNRILHIFLSKVLLPHGGPYTTLTHPDLVLLWALNKGKDINWSSTIQWHMECSQRSATSTLPYSILVTKILQDFGVPLEAKESLPTDTWHHLIGTPFLNKAHIGFVGNEWIVTTIGPHSSKAIASHGFLPEAEAEAPPPTAASSSSSSVTDSVKALLEQHLSAVDARIEHHVGLAKQELGSKIDAHFESLKKEAELRYALLSSQIDQLRSSGSTRGTGTGSPMNIEDYFNFPTPQTQPQQDEPFPDQPPH